MQQLLQPVSAAAACSHSSWMSISAYTPLYLFDVTAEDEDVEHDDVTADDVDVGWS